ncbi:MAG: glycoside hydrolase family 2 TIM barrel-domain containing protein [[Ruminococcus] gnavus]|nr:glycoside hydrolase family 2 TIM barrel-domain containing protein [Mediterraneibacter gnavus]
MRNKQNFDKNWMYIIDEIGPLPKTYAKSGIVAGVSNAVDGELFEPFAGAGNMLRALQDILPAGDDAKGDVDAANMLMGNLPEKAKSAKNWKRVNLPHDFRVEIGVSDEATNWAQGYIPDGIAYYRKAFKVPKETLGKRVVLEFDGVMRNASFWYNGCFIGDHYSGYTGFQFDVTELTKYGDDEGDNVILVRCDTTNGSEGWWYEGGGIYRHTWLTTYEDIHVDRWGVFVKPTVSGTHATLDIETTVCNETFAEASYTVCTTVLDPDGREVGQAETAGNLPIYGKDTQKCQMEVTDAMLWDCNHPYLYTAVTEVFTGEKLVDHYETTFGIRSIEYTTEGLLLNGVHTPLYGTCFHQDFVGVGAAIPDAIQNYKIQKIRNVGFNAFRSSHNPATLELLDACDQLGVLVINENRIIETSKHRMEDLEELIKSSRNHPCVFAWSMSNEEIFAGSYQALRILDKMLPFAKSLDDSRLFLSAEAFLSGDMAAKYGMEIYDVFGMNYAESSLNNNQIATLSANYPDMKFLSTESASWYTTRGIYEDNKERGHCSSYGTRYVMMGGEGGSNAGGTARPWQTWRFYKENPKTGGFFIWTGFDYRGEPTPLKEYQVCSNFGIMDTCGFPKDDCFYYEARMKENPLIHIMPHWTWEKEGEIKVIRLYTNCDEADLILNGISLGRKPLEGDWIEYEVPYQPGELKAIGYRDGEEVASDVQRTAGKPAAIRMEADRPVISADGRDVACVKVSIVDAQGIMVPNAENNVTFEVTGAGSLLGLGNGDPGCRENDKASSRHAFSGLLLALVQSKEESGEVKVRASSPELETCELTICTK